MTSLEQKVMANVSVIYAGRKLTSRVAIECYALAVSAFTMTLFVSVSHVFSNFLVASQNINSLGLYVLSAVTQTTHVVQLVLIVATAALLALCIDLVRSTQTPQHSF
jgi:hypothetical protein